MGMDLLAGAAARRKKRNVKKQTKKERQFPRNIGKKSPDYKNESPPELFTSGTSEEEKALIVTDCLFKQENVKIQHPVTKSPVSVGSIKLPATSSHSQWSPSRSSSNVDLRRTHRWSKADSNITNVEEQISGISGREESDGCYAEENIEPERDLTITSNNDAEQDSSITSSSIDESDYPKDIASKILDIKMNCDEELSKIFEDIKRKCAEISSLETMLSQKRLYVQQRKIEIFERKRKKRVGNTIYVSGNKLTDEFLRNHFNAFGDIINISMEIEKGRGFITFAKPESADRAISEMNGKPADGVQLLVQLARRQPQIDLITDASSSAV
ncbi:hypothetical protein HA402_001747 [Bradysia odoriphaga]|nr:hypothetical protein HA402_001747 [Bradysia odoriphaga]